MSYLLGIDISDFQLTLPSLAASDIDFVFIKVSDGVGGRQAHAIENWKRVRGEGKKVGGYHWLKTRPGMSGTDQADFACEQLGLVDFGSDCLPLMLDIEDDTGKTVSGERVVEIAEDFVRRVRENLARNVIVYSGTWFWERIGNPDSDLLSSMVYCHSGYPRNEGGSDNSAYHKAARAALARGHGPIAFPWQSRGIKEPFWQFDGTGGLALPNQRDSDFIVFNGGLFDLELLIAASAYEPARALEVGVPWWTTATSLRGAGLDIDEPED